MKLEVADVSEVIAGLPAASQVLDFGCFRWRLAQACSTHGHALIGIDREEPPGRPAGCAFARFRPTPEGPRIELPDDCADLTVAAHVLEHVLDQVAVFAELVRLTRPGGLLFVEAPSELSLLGRSSEDPTDHHFYSFWDDPTRLRPLTPGSLYRLALSAGVHPLGIARAQAGDIPSVRMLSRKPASLKGAPQTRYISLADVPAGLEAAWRAMWPAPLAASRITEMRAAAQEQEQGLSGPCC